MRIGMVCYASLGGSGVVATELARALAGRGHELHVISSDPPFRWQEGLDRLTFHRVSTPAYPLFREPQYLLALANAIAHIADSMRLDIVHAHYAVPHATAAYLADQMMTSAHTSTRPRMLTTLHGTDITLIGSDPSYSWVVGFSIERSHGVTAVSESLRHDTAALVGIQRGIDVIPNFLDCSRYRRHFDPARRQRLLSPDAEALLVHMSNFRPVKRVEVVVEIFRRVRQVLKARLLLIGDGPVRPEVDRLVRLHGLQDHVVFVGEEHDPVQWLSVADLFLLPSLQESFGLAALEAMACEVPVIASNVGGLPEIVRDGISGYTCDPDDVAGMVSRAVALLRDAPRRTAMGRAAADIVRTEYCVERIVPLYEAAYERALGM
jgi:N-acetyl-alpha-D-glucosaminyl L-malate synthase BshA